MLRTVLFLVIGLQQLMPPGMCICRLIPGGLSGAHAASRILPAGRLTPRDPGAGCACCRAKWEAATQGEAAAGVVLGCTCGRAADCSTPCPAQKPCPGCPVAVAAVDRLAWGERDPGFGLWMPAWPAPAFHVTAVPPGPGGEAVTLPAPAGRAFFRLTHVLRC